MREQLGEAGVDAGAEHRRAAALARVDDAIAIGAEAAAVDERGRADDVDARFEDAHELVDVRPHRVVDDAVGLQREQRVDVVGGGDARRHRCRTAHRRRVRPCRATTRSSRRARARDARRSARTDRLPTLPVVHCTTRIAMRECLAVGAATAVNPRSGRSSRRRGRPRRDRRSNRSPFRASR